MNTKLGTRYLVVVYRADFHKTADATLYRDENQANQHIHNINDNPYVEHAQIRQIDLDDQLLADPTDEERYQHAERMMLKYEAEVIRLRPIVEPGLKSSPDDREQMRAVIEAMRPIVDAATQWMRNKLDERVPGSCGYSLSDTNLLVGIDNCRERLATAMSAWRDSQTVSENERLRGENAQMRTVVDAAIAYVTDENVQDASALDAAVDAFIKLAQFRRQIDEVLHQRDAGLNPPGS